MEFKHLFLLAFGVLLISSLSFAVSDEDRATKVLGVTADNLGWPNNVFQEEDSDVAGGTTLTISEDGTEDAERKATITVFGTDMESGFIMDFYLGEGFGLEDSSYQGRKARIQTPGENCEPKGFITVMIVGMINSWISGITGEESDDTCIDQNGVIAWTCGKYLFMVGDETEEGGTGEDIAAALYAAAEEEALCDYGDTLFIMVDTSDLAGSDMIEEQVERAQKVNQYYGVNSYNSYPPFKFTFKDADGSKGADDWYHLPNTMGSYSPLNFQKYQEDAIKEVFKGADVPEDIYFERVFILYPGESQQKDPTAVLYDACAWHKDSYYIEVDAMQGKKRIYSKNFIFMSENRDLGTWVHEFGHSIPSKYHIPPPPDFARISDRYTYTNLPYGKYGEVDSWGVMGYGSWWGGNGEIPVQMMSFTKESAGWLTYSNAELNKSYTLTALENMKAGDAILRLDDPASNDANQFYIIEARNGNTFFGAPETGVVIYKVNMKDGYYVVNIISTLDSHSATGNRDYKRPTLFSGSQPYTNVPGKFRITPVSISDTVSTVKIEEFAPAAVVGAVAQPGANALAAAPAAHPNVNSPPFDSFEVKPDTDLHAYDGNGNHVGMNYQAEQYEVNIPGAYASGDLIGDEEWIFVPEGTQVRFEVSSHDTQVYLSNHPELASYAKPETVTTTMVKYDSSGVRSEANAGETSVPAGQNVPLKSPTDSSLKYEKKDIPGVGSNSLCPLLFVFPLLLGFAFLARKN